MSLRGFQQPPRFSALFFHEDAHRLSRLVRGCFQLNAARSEVHVSSEPSVICDNHEQQPHKRAGLLINIYFFLTKHMINKRVSSLKTMSNNHVTQKSWTSLFISFCLKETMSYNGVGLARARARAPSFSPLIYLADR